MYHDRISICRYCMFRAILVLMPTFYLGLTVRPPSLSAQSTSTPPSAYVQEWLYIGPFESQPIPQSLTDSFPNAGDIVNEVGDTSYVWRSYQSPFDVIDISPATVVDTTYRGYRMGTDNMLFFTNIQSERAVRAYFRLGSSGPVDVWFNGELVFSFDEAHLYELDGFHFFVDLKPGPNPIFVANTGWHTDWAFSLTQPILDGPFIRGVVSDPQGKPARGVELLLYCQNKVAYRYTTFAQGTFAIPVPEPGCHLKASKNDEGSWITSIAPFTIANQTYRIRLRKSPYISGHLYMPDESTPLSSVYLEAIQKGTNRVVARALTSKRGSYRLLNIPPGEYFIKRRPDEIAQPIRSAEYVDPISKTVTVKRNASASDVDLVLPEVRKGTWTSLTALDGLPHYHLRDLSLTEDGQLICGTNGGFCVFDGNTFTSFNSRSGLLSDVITSVTSIGPSQYLVGSHLGINLVDDGVISHLSDPDGQPIPAVNTLIEDHSGNLWVGAHDGIYTSISDSTLAPRIDISSALPSQIVTALAQDGDGTLWIGTTLGASTLDGSGLRAIPELVGLSVNDFFHQRDGTTWIATTGALFRQDDQGIEKFTIHDGLAGDGIMSMCESESDRLWIATLNGLVSFQENTFTMHPHPEGGEFDVVTDVECGGYKAIWASSHRGLTRFDYSTATYGIQDGLSKHAHPDKLAGAFTVKAFNPQQVYLGTGWGGLFSFDGQKLQRVYDANKEVYIRSIAALNDETSDELLLATHEGMFTYHADSVYSLDTDPWVITAHKDHDGYIWMGWGWGGNGVKKFDPVSQRVVEHYRVNDGLPDNNVWSIAQKNDGSIWIGTSKGLASYQSGSFTNVTQQFGLESSAIYDILITDDNTNWFGGISGVFRNQGDTWSHFTKQGLFSLHEGDWILEDPFLKLPDDAIWSLHQTEDGIVWFGTQSRGLVGYDGTTFSNIDSRQGLLGNQVMSVDSDTTGAMWIATLDGGLTRFDRYRNPRSIRLTTMHSGSKTYHFTEKRPPIYAARPLTINYRTIDLSLAGGIGHKYHVSIRDNNNEIVEQSFTPNNQITWTPSSPGTYHISVQLVDQQLFYSEPATASIRVKWPLGRNPLLLIPGIIALLCLIIFAANSNIQYTRKKREAVALQKQMLAQEQQARLELEGKNSLLEKAYKKAEYATAAKSQFLSHMSHELRTPMNGVIGMTSLLMGTQLDEEQYDFVETIRSSGEALLGVINDVLDFSKIEAGKLEIEKLPLNLRKCTEDVLDLVSPMADSKGLQLAYFMDESAPEMIIQDAIRYRQILTNLLSNAVKFTNEGSVSVRIDANYVDEFKVEYAIHVQDSGIGIPPERMNRLFKSFSQVDASTSRRFGGTGLGLAISKQLSELLGGRMWVESEEGVGSTFSFSLPAAVKPEKTHTPQPIVSSSPFHILLIGFSDFEQQALGHHLQAIGLETTFRPSYHNLQDLPRHPYDACVGSIQYASELSMLDTLATRYPGYPMLRYLRRNDLHPPTNAPRVINLYKPIKPRQLQNALVRLFEAIQDTKEPKHSLQSMRVLLAESNTIHQKIVLKVFSQHGIQVDTVTHGEAVLPLLKKKSFDIVILDMGLPDQSGLEVARAIRESANTLKPQVVVATEAGTVLMQDELEEIGIQSIIKKPYKAEQLTALLKHESLTT